MWIKIIEDAGVTFVEVCSVTFTSKFKSDEVVITLLPAKGGSAILRHLPVDRALQFDQQFTKALVDHSRLVLLNCSQTVLFFPPDTIHKRNLNEETT